MNTLSLQELLNVNCGVTARDNGRCRISILIENPVTGSISTTDVAFAQYGMDEFPEQLVFVPRFPLAKLDSDKGEL